jgi:hypothetical protein
MSNNAGKPYFIILFLAVLPPTTAYLFLETLLVRIEKMYKFLFFGTVHPSQERHGIGRLQAEATINLICTFLVFLQNLFKLTVDSAGYVLFTPFPN